MIGLLLNQKRRRRRALLLLLLAALAVFAVVQTVRLANVKKAPADWLADACLEAGRYLSEYQLSDTDRTYREALAAVSKAHILALRAAEDEPMRSLADQLSYLEENLKYHPKGVRACLARYQTVKYFTGYAENRSASYLDDGLLSLNNAAVLADAEEGENDA